MSDRHGDLRDEFGIPSREAEGIPVYVFVLREVITGLQLWRANPTADFSPIVDNPGIFGFVDSIYNDKSHWIYAFESATDIIETLRFQLAVLFSDSLRVRHQMQEAKLPRSLSDLTGPALRLAVERPAGWEVRLFSHVLAEEMEGATPLRRDLEYGLILEPFRGFQDIGQLADWLSLQIEEISAVAESAGRLVNVGLQKAMGDPGLPGDVDQLVYIARRLATAYRSLIRWTMAFHHVRGPEGTEKLIAAAARFTENAIPEMEGFSRDLEAELAKILILPDGTAGPATIRVDCSLTMPELTEFNEELRRLRRRFGLTDNEGS